jgi:hypothetical protein
VESGPMQLGRFPSGMDDSILTISKVHSGQRSFTTVR